MTPAAIPAATLILIRETAGPLEMLMVERAAGMTAFGGAMVFPGGRIDAADERLAAGFADPLAAARIAAIRETLEETAIPAGLAPVPPEGLALELQAALHAGADLGTVIDEAGLKLDLGALTYFTRWRPDHRPGRRFDTHFFVAKSVTAERAPRHQPAECAGAHWLSQPDIEAREQAGSAQLVFPTRCNIRRIGQHGSFAEVLADAAAHPAELIRPSLEEREDGVWITIPETLGYPMTSEPWHSANADGTPARPA